MITGAGRAMSSVSRISLAPYPKTSRDTVLTSNGWKSKKIACKGGQKTHWISPDLKLEFRTLSAALEFVKLCIGRSEEEALCYYIRARKGNPQGLEIISGHGSVEAAKQNVATFVSDSRNDNANECYICGDGGVLVCCDHCPKSFHLNCHIPRLRSDQLPEEWKCCECLASEMVFMSSGDCKGELVVFYSGLESVVSTQPHCCFLTRLFRIKIL